MFGKLRLDSEHLQLLPVFATALMQCIVGRRNTQPGRSAAESLGIRMKIRYFGTLQMVHVAEPVHSGPVPGSAQEWFRLPEDKNATLRPAHGDGVLDELSWH